MLRVGNIRIAVIPYDLGNILIQGAAHVNNLRIDAEGRIQHRIRPGTDGVHGGGSVQEVEFKRIRAGFHMHSLVLPRVVGNGRGILRHLFIQPKEAALHGIKRGHGRSQIGNLPVGAYRLHQVLQPGEHALVVGDVQVNKALGASLVRKYQAIGGILELGVSHGEIRTRQNRILGGSRQADLLFRIGGYKAHQGIIHESDGHIQLGFVQTLESRLETVQVFLGDVHLGFCLIQLFFQLHAHFLAVHLRHLAGQAVVGLVIQGNQSMKFHVLREVGVLQGGLGLGQGVRSQFGGYHHGRRSSLGRAQIHQISPLDKHLNVPVDHCLLGRVTGALASISGGLEKLVSGQNSLHLVQPHAGKSGLRAIHPRSPFGAEADHRVNDGGVDGALFPDGLGCILSRNGYGFISVFPSGAGTPGFDHVQILNAPDHAGDVVNTGYNTHVHGKEGGDSEPFRTLRHQIGGNGSGGIKRRSRG